MWIHINHGDEGLRRFLYRLRDLVSSKDHPGSVLVEPQQWKSYKNAMKRMKKLELEPPAAWATLLMKETVEEDIIRIIEDDLQMESIASLGRNDWGRSLVLFHYVNDTSRKKSKHCDDVIL